MSFLLSPTNIAQDLTTDQHQLSSVKYLLQHMDCEQCPIFLCKVTARETKAGEPSRDKRMHKPEKKE